MPSKIIHEVVNSIQVVGIKPSSSLYSSYMLLLFHLLWKRICEPKLTNKLHDVSISQIITTQVSWLLYLDGLPIGFMSCSPYSCERKKKKMMEDMMNTKDNVLRKVCNMVGFQMLNTHQENVVWFIVHEKSDVFVNHPTGFGKAVVFQPFALMFIISSKTVTKTLSTTAL